MSHITIKDVRKSYGSMDVVHGVSLDIFEGEFVILVGPSGCGKSTLLRMIAGLESITSGDVIVDDLIINKLPPRERVIAMVFQSYALYPHMKVRKNMAFSLKLAGAPAHEIEEKVATAAEILSLQELLDRKPAQLSGGQRQRVAMGRAIVRNPKLFLFDEPLSNLDAKLRVQMRSEIKELHQRLKTTTVYVTHDQVEAMTMADRIVVMNAGNIEQIGAPMDLYDKPETLFVASFIGSPSMNMLNGQIVEEDGDRVFKSDTGTTISLGQNVVETEIGTPVVLGIRPENIGINPDLAQFGKATIRVVEPTGSETLLALKLAQDNLLVLARDRQIFEVGAVMNLSADPSDFHFFNAKTGQRL
ncbi:MAG: ABC transporter ATP-binding protein [Hyphomicrobiales bacterium]